MTRRRKDAYDVEQAAVNVAYRHELFGPDETRHDLTFAGTMVAIEREMLTHLTKLRELATGRGEKWSATYAVRRCEERIAFYEARAAKAQELLA